MVRISKLRKENLLGAGNLLPCHHLNTAQLCIPEHGINHMMQTYCSAEPHQKAIKECADRTCHSDILSAGNQQILERRPDNKENHADKNGNHCSDNRHKPGSAEKSHYLGQLYIMVAVVKPYRCTAYCNSTYSAGINGISARRENIDHGCNGCIHNKITNYAGQSRSPFILFGKAHTETHTEQQH